MPYEVFVSGSNPSAIEDMEKVKSTSDTSLYIEECGGKPLVYGKDYWVAVIARDNTGNYDDCFAICGPVRTYEDMDIKLDEGWNLKIRTEKSAYIKCGHTIRLWQGQHSPLLER